MRRVGSTQSKAVDDLGLSEPVRMAIRDVQEELADAYRDSFVAMVEAMNRQASAIDRIQTTLELLVRNTRPDLAGQIPPVIGIAQAGEEPDLATAVVVADPIAKGYTMSQASLARAVGISQTDVSVLSKEFRLWEDGDCAVVVRKGKKSRLVNYHPRAIDRLRELVRSPPAGMTEKQRTVITRVQRKLASG